MRQSNAAEEKSESVLDLESNEISADKFVIDKVEINGFTKSGRGTE